MVNTKVTFWLKDLDFHHTELHTRYIQSKPLPALSWEVGIVTTTVIWKYVLRRLGSDSYFVEFLLFCPSHVSLYSALFVYTVKPVLGRYNDLSPSSLTVPKVQTGYNKDWCRMNHWYCAVKLHRGAWLHFSQQGAKTFSERSQGHEGKEKIWIAEEGGRVFKGSSQTHIHRHTLPPYTHTQHTQSSHCSHRSHWWKVCLCSRVVCRGHLHGRLIGECKDPFIFHRDRPRTLGPPWQTTHNSPEGEWS